MRSTTYMYKNKASLFCFPKSSRLWPTKMTGPGGFGPQHWFLHPSLVGSGAWELYAYCRAEWENEGMLTQNSRYLVICIKVEWGKTWF